MAAVGDLPCTPASQDRLQPLFARMTESADLLLLAGDLTDREVHGIGMAGVKAFARGFGHRALGAWGEPVTKQPRVSSASQHDDDTIASRSFHIV